MELQNSFAVSAPPDAVFAFLLDPSRVVSCVPGAELSETVDASTFKGKVKIKVGPITVSYAGTARISERDEAAHTATLEGEGRETQGAGSARATARMAVTADGAGSTVTITTDYTVAGRVAQFGRGVMQDVSKRLVSQMAACIKQSLESAQSQPAGEGLGAAPAPVAAPPQAKPVNAIGLFFSVLWDRIKALFGGKTSA